MGSPHTTHMRQDDLSSDKHQIVYADSCPIPSTVVTTHAKLCTYFSSFVEEQPDVIALLHSA